MPYILSGLQFGGCVVRGCPYQHAQVKYYALELLVAWNEENQLKLLP